MKKEPLVLPEPNGEPITLTEKVFVPVKDHPDVSYFLFFYKIIFLFEFNQYLRCYTVSIDADTDR